MLASTAVRMPLLQAALSEDTQNAILAVKIEFHDLDGKRVCIAAGTRMIVDTSKNVGLVGDIHFEVFPDEYDLILN